ncbi:hypothetical protein CANMA_004671 [Candida margitis]|uniref:uncharacterized protein n=1 Tax=Candida margitis TaxID=1775924 RepID=UPI00222758B9|nr:uncharacterized protein CANMA_004671 [Candida margitis]KAI5953833.1 hypothetical protein CANMA_004671 [Candida margitis]
MSFLISPLSSHRLTPPPPPQDGDDGKCELIGTFSLLTQAFLGFICLSSLIIKRFYEYPIRRTWPVWSFDVSKQLIGALGVHVFNVILSVLKTAPGLMMMYKKRSDKAGDGDGGDSEVDDPCDWYFLNIVFDCTIGVYILYLVFRGVNYICKRIFHITQIDSGEYGDVNHPSWKAFSKQLAIYFASLMITKLILYGLVEIFERELLWITSHILLRWLDEYPDEVEIFLVMFVIPIIMNCLQLILIDNFIRNQVWFESNKLLRFKYPNFDEETASTRQREIDEVLNVEREEREQREEHNSGNDHHRRNGNYKHYGSTS